MDVRSESGRGRVPVHLITVRYPLAFLHDRPWLTDLQSHHSSSDLALSRQFRSPSVPQLALVPSAARRTSSSASPFVTRPPSHQSICPIRPINRLNFSLTTSVSHISSPTRRRGRSSRTPAKRPRDPEVFVAWTITFATLCLALLSSHRSWSSSAARSLLPPRPWELAQVSPSFLTAQASSYQ